MKKVLFVLLTLLVLAACGESNAYHDEIRTSFAKDTESIRDIVIKAIEEERDPTEKEQGKIDNYILNYDKNLDSEHEVHAYLLTRYLIDNQSTSMLPSEIENTINYADNIQITLEGGFEAYREANKEEETSKTSQ
ncbi:hypothetical protein BME96_08945 [Virgibacillus halodenitrificans]|uniref:Lipoprotein n=1 Tax=Virgibacillus halodenitrificans TaxID=1482 RepID=A0AAC9IZ74_VIRHA|nr:hypothetical protein [Virgibacillus halodenitrificans]APC48287.1 hypothetical protein BME96_08945 [Virgibacillus halodenitrificans]